MTSALRSLWLSVDAEVYEIFVYSGLTKEAFLRQYPKQLNEIIRDAGAEGPLTSRRLKAGAKRGVRPSVEALRKEVPKKDDSEEA